MYRVLVAAVLAVLVVAPATAWAQASAEIDRVDDLVVYRVPVGQAYRSQLTNNSLAAVDQSRLELWTFRAEAGQCVAATMSSRTFPPAIALLYGSPDSGDPVAQDANRAGRSTASVRATLDNGGDYFIKTTSAGSGFRTGEYTLSLRACG
jgi:hypothetical protein